MTSSVGGTSDTCSGVGGRRSTTYDVGCSEVPATSERRRYQGRTPREVTADAPTSASDSFPWVGAKPPSGFRIGGTAPIDRGLGRHGPSSGDAGENVPERVQGPRLSPVAYVRDLNARHARFWSAVAELRLVRR